MSDKVRTPSKMGGSPSQRGFSPFNSKSPRSMGLRSMEATTSKETLAVAIKLNNCYQILAGQANP